MSCFALVGLRLCLSISACMHRYGAPFHLYTADEYAAFSPSTRLASGTLSAFVGLTFASALPSESRR